MAYKLMKIKILRGDYDIAEISEKLDAYLAFGRITLTQYKELMEMAEKDNENAGISD